MSAHKAKSLMLTVTQKFRRNTRIELSIPSNIIQATLLISNDAGSVVRNMPIAQRGTISVNGSTRTPGVYFYTLLLDGNHVEVKKMILLK